MIAVADTGLGDGTAAGGHADLPAGRISAIHNWPGTAGGICFSAITNDGAVVGEGERVLIRDLR